MLYTLKSYSTTKKACKNIACRFERLHIADGIKQIKLYAHHHNSGVDMHATFFGTPCADMPNGYFKMVFNARTVLDYIYFKTLKSTPATTVQTHGAQSLPILSAT